MVYKVTNCYGSFSLEAENTELSYLDIKDKIVQTLNGETGYIRIVGTNNVVEHGYSAVENIHKIITLDYKVIDVPNKLEVIE